MARTKVTKRKKGDHSATNMLRAIQMHRRGLRVRKAAKECGVTYPTLFRYIKKHANVSDTQLQNERLTPNYDVNKIFTTEQEAILKGYIEDCALKFYGLCSKKARKVSYQMAKINNIKCPASWEKDKMAGIEWLRSFKSRHSDLSLKKPEACSLARATAFNRETVKTFFTNLKNVMERHPSFGTGCRLYNLDETATTTVQKPQKVLAPKGRNVGKITSGEKGILVTTCAIVCASGQALPPVLIFPRKNFKDFMLHGAPPGSLGLANPTGWMNSDLFVQVMQHFIKHTCASPENPALLIMDNHESHLSIEALDLAKKSGVTILTLHPHTTAKMQPLDVGLNGPFKIYYNSAVDSWLMRNPGKAMTIYNIAECVGQAYAKSMTPTNIASAFNKCGIFPYNADIFTDIDFMPSAVTDREQPGPSSTGPEMLLHERENVGSPASDVTFAESPLTIQDDLLRMGDSPNILEASELIVGEVSAQTDSAYAEKPLQEAIEPFPNTSNRATTPFVDEILASSSLVTTNFISPQEFMPQLKAAPRTGKRKPRKLGKSMIATDTPEKNLIAEERQRAKDRKSAAKKIKKPVLNDKKCVIKKTKNPVVCDKRGKKKSKKIIQSDSETSIEEDIEVMDLSETDLSGIDDDEDIDDDLPLITETFKKMERKPQEGDYVLVLFDTKKLNVYYIAKIIEEINANTYGASFLRLKEKDSMKFYMPLEPDLSEIHIRDIKVILPPPKINGSKNRNSTYVFPVRVSSTINMR